MTPEKKVKIKVCEILKANDCYYFYASTGGYGASGIPDIVACYKGLFLGIECKANGNKATALQLKHLTLIKQAGGYSTIIDEHNVNTLEATLKHLQ
tara:strand:- start:1170 stop:1457 length:288 start_codon:yes stop_codon:yes gene_type:complete